MRKGKVRITVIGSANVDLVTFAEKMPRAGETLFGRSFVFGFGGKGANQAVAARLCGAQVELVARVGEDFFGKALRNRFRALGIGTRHLKTARGISTGVATILVSPSAQNRIVVVPGANDKLTSRDVREAAPTLERADLLLLQFETPMPAVEAAIRIANKNGVRCLLNPAPARPVALERLREAHYFIPNETEAEAVTGMPLRSMSQAKKCAQHLLDKGFSRVLITLGAKGVLFARGQSIVLIPSFPVTPMDTTGAGDAFVGSFAVFLAEGHPEREAAARANLYAALSTTRQGTQASYLKRAAFERQWRARGGPSAVRALS